MLLDNKVTIHTTLNSLIIHDSSSSSSSILLLATREMSSGMCRWRMCRWWKQSQRGKQTWIGKC